MALMSRELRPPPPTYSLPHAPLAEEGWEEGGENTQSPWRISRPGAALERGAS